MDRIDRQISLNLIAIGAFGITLSSLVAPLFEVSPTLPILAMGAIVLIATLDSFWFQSLLATLIVDTIAGSTSEYRERILHHEAGHFLIAHLAGIEIQSYSLTAWEALKQGQAAKGGVVFAPLQSGEISAELLQQYAQIWMAGIAAEQLKFDRSEGGMADRQKLRGVLSLIKKSQAEIRQTENLAILQAKTIIQSEEAAYQALIAAMRDRSTVAECCQKIDRLQQASLVT
jgi:hypothetical protein